MGAGLAPPIRGMFQSHRACGKCALNQGLRDISAAAYPSAEKPSFRLRLAAADKNTTVFFTTECVLALFASGTGNYLRQKPVGGFG